MSAPTPNFAFLERYSPLLVRLGSLAELYVTQDANTAVLKLRQFAEALLQQVAARTGVDANSASSQFDVLRELEYRRVLPRDVADLFHRIRRAGNKAAHAFQETPGEATHLLKLARELVGVSRRRRTSSSR